MPEIPIFRRQRQEVDKFEANLIYAMRICFNKNKLGPGVVAHACNPSYLGGGDQEDSSLRPAWAKC
jgi:hypothetical protein